MTLCTDLFWVLDGAPVAIINHIYVIVTWQLEDTLWAGLTDLHIKTPMGITAENLAEKYEITREACDNYAYQTQQRWKAGKTVPHVSHDKIQAYFKWLIGRFLWFPAHEAGYYTAEIAPIDVKAKKGKVAMAQDEHPRPQTTLEQMAKLAPVFKKGGTVTAANASVRLQLATLKWPGFFQPLSLRGLLCCVCCFYPLDAFLVNATLGFWSPGCLRWCSCCGNCKWRCSERAQTCSPG